MARRIDPPIHPDDIGIDDEPTSAELLATLEEHVEQRTKLRREEIRDQIDAGLIDSEKVDKYLELRSERVSLDLPEHLPTLSEEDIVALRRRMDRNHYLKGNTPPVPVEFVDGSVRAMHVKAFDESKPHSAYTKVSSDATFDKVNQQFDFDLLTSHGFDIDFPERSQTLLYGQLDYRISGGWFNNPGKITVRPLLSVDGTVFQHGGMDADPQSYGNAWMGVALQLFREDCTDPIDCAGYSGLQYLYGKWTYETWGLETISHHGTLNGLEASLDVEPESDVKVRMLFLAGTLVDGPGCVTSIAVKSPDFVGIPDFETDFHPYELQMETPEWSRYPGSPLSIPESYINRVQPKE